MTATNLPSCRDGGYSTAVDGCHVRLCEAGQCGACKDEAPQPLGLRLLKDHLHGLAVGSR